MAASTHCVTLDGLSGRAVEVEVDVSSGMPATVVVGLADAMVSESRDRVRSAVVNSGTSWPDHRVTINLAPSSLPKSGSHYDLAIAVAVFASKKLVPPSALDSTVLIGELALDGRLRATRGILPAAIAAHQAGFQRVIVPEVHLSEAVLVAGIESIGARSLRGVIALLNGEPLPADPPVAPLALTDDTPWARSDGVSHLDIDDVVGQLDAKVALTVAAAGGHHLAMTGPPGIGKTMLAQRMSGLLPDLDHHDSLEVSAVHSIAGHLRAESPLVRRPPFLDPHHTASSVAIVGGGSRIVRPGAMSLAHHGTLFLDEAPEFASNVLDALRQPLESGRVVVSRAAQTVAFPAKFQLILAANPCPCGHSGSVGERCECTPAMRRRYSDRISGPIRDRIDIHRTLVAPARAELMLESGSVGGTKRCAEHVQLARARQMARFSSTPWRLNSEVPGVEFRRHWPPDDQGRRLLEAQLRSHKLSARAIDRVVKVAWSVTDLSGNDRPGVDEIDAALALRRGTAVGGALRSLVAPA